MEQEKDIYSDAQDKIQNQFDVRSEGFDVSANWIVDKALIDGHVDLCGEVKGEILELCCGTGQVGKALKEKGWEVKGVDVCRSMVAKSGAHFPVSESRAEEVPHEDNSFEAVVCRQSFQFLDAKKVLSEVKRVLKPGGVFVVSLTVPFSEVDKEYLVKIHRTKQPLLLKFYSAEDLIAEIEKAGFEIVDQKTLEVRESINKWMDNAPELTQAVRDKVVEVVKDAPEEYSNLHNVKVENGEVCEDWHWIVLKAQVKE